MAPYLLMGFLIAGILHVYVPRGAFTKYFGKNNLKSVLYAALMGIPLPLCSCGVIPTGMSLYKEGASKGATVSFLISTPQTGVDSIIVTYSLLGLPFAIIRPIIALITGLFGGLAVNLSQSQNDNADFRDTGAVELSHDGNKIKKIFSYAFDEFFEDIADWLVIGLALAAVIAVIIPDDFFQSTIFSNELLSMFIVLIASIPFYVCATGSVPIAAVLLLKGLNPGAVLVFLMAGPATNIATITVISKVLGNKTLAIYLSTIIIGAFVFGIILNSFFPPEIFTAVIPEIGHHSGLIMTWIEIISSGLFIFLLLRIYFMKIRRRLNKRKGMEKSSEQTITLEVDGMSCQNCAIKVESALMDLAEVNESHVNIEANTVEIKGNEIEVEHLISSVEKAGYKFKKVIT